MGVDVKVVWAYGYLVPCEQFAKLCRGLQMQLRKMRRPLVAAHDLATHFSSRDIIRTISEYLGLSASAKRKQTQFRFQTKEGPRKRRRMEEAAAEFDPFQPHQAEDDEQFDIAWYGTHSDHYNGWDWTYFLREDLDSTDVRILFQDMYGDAEGDACVFLYWAPTANVLVNRRAGFTPLSFVRDQIYTDDSDFIRAGARRFLAIAELNDPAQDENANRNKAHIDDWLAWTQEKQDGKPYCLFYEQLGERLQTKEYKKHFNRWLVSAYD